jgi:methionyl aminopeptidase
MPAMRKRETLPLQTEMNPEIYQAYQTAGEIASRVRRELHRHVKPETSLLTLAEYIEERTVELGGKPAFPANISVNEVASHFTPQDETPLLQRGDVVKIDFGVHINGYIADTAITLEVETSNHQPLIHATKKALDNAIKIIRDGTTTKTLGKTIHHTIKKEGFNTLKELTGHNLSRYTLHAGITIPNYKPLYNTTLKTGDVIAIEPFATYGSGEIIKKSPTIYALQPEKHHMKHPLYEKIQTRFNTLPFTKRWIKFDITSLQSAGFIRRYPVLVTRDRQIVAQSEETLIIEKDGATIITK